jgi:predicted transport protein
MVWRGKNKGEKGVWKMAEEPKKGIVYIVQNPAFPHLFKIGYTGKDTIEDRLSVLNASNVPESFKVVFRYKCNNPKKIEDDLHKLFKQYRHYKKNGSQTEFFYIGCLSDAKKYLENLEGAKKISGDYISNNENDDAEYDETKNMEIYDRDEVSNYIKSLGDNISVEEKQKYYPFKKDKKNFIGILKNERILTLILKLNPKTVKIENGFTRDVSKIGTFAPGDLEVRIKNEADFEKAMPLIKRAYDEN